MTLVYCIPLIKFSSLQRQLLGEAVSRGSQLFCIGNPSNVDLESHEEEDPELDLPSWHASVGTCESRRLSQSIYSYGDGRAMQTLPSTHARGTEGLNQSMRKSERCCSTVVGRIGVTRARRCLINMGRSLDCTTHGMIERVCDTDRNYSIYTK